MDDRDPFDLRRFTEAQEHAGTYARALQELHDGRKVTHWIWFVFPQIEGLGRSPTARRFAIRSLEEAVAYLRHPVLGPRLLQCTAAVSGHRDRSAEQILGDIDATKLRSSMTLFAKASSTLADRGEYEGFQAVLARFYDGVPDPETVRRL